MKTTLFESKTPDIWINITIYEDADKQIVVHGHDIGKRVEEFKGRRDYEYILSIKKEDVTQLMKQLELTTKEALFDWFIINYSTSNAVSAVRNKMDELGITCSFFTW